MYNIKRNVLVARPRDVLLAVCVTLFGFLQIRSFDHLVNLIAHNKLEIYYYHYQTYHSKDE